MTQKKAQLMVPPTSGRIGAVKAGTNITIGLDGTICASGGSSVFLADGYNNIWSCLSPSVYSYFCTNNNFLVGSNAGFCLSLSGNSSYENIFIGKESGYGSNSRNNIFLGSCSGRNEKGFANIFIGKEAGRAFIGSWYYEQYITIVNSTTISAQHNRSYRVTMNGALAGVGAVLIISRNDVGALPQLTGTIQVEYPGSGFVTGELITIPGNLVGGSTPADNVVLQLPTVYTPETYPVPRNQYRNISIGELSSSCSSTSSDVVALGSYAGQFAGQSNDFSNIYIGTHAGRFAYKNFYNTFVGPYAGCRASGQANFSNTFIGAFSGIGNSINDNFYQTFVGAYTGMNVCTGPDNWQYQNTLFGAFSGTDITVGQGNTLSGTYSGWQVTTGNHNAFFGLWTGEAITTGSYNTAFGSFAFGQRYLSSSASYNSVFGNAAGALISCGSRGNSALGNQAGRGAWNCFVSGSGWLACSVGSVASYSVGTTLVSQANCSYLYRTQLGAVIGVTPDTFSTRPLIKVQRDGAGAISSVILLDSGGGIWTFAGNPVTVPGTAIGGISPADDITVTWGNFFNGACSGNNNTWLGNLSGASASCGCCNFYGGYLSGSLQKGSHNVGIGTYSGLCNSGNDNILIGRCSGFKTSGSCNNFLGLYSGCLNTSGSCNVAIGHCAGTDAVLTLTTQSNQIVIGNNSSTNAFIKIGWTVTSDQRDKTCVSQIAHGREFLQKLDPVRFNWKNRESGEVTDEQPRYGFLAQQVLEAEGEPAILVDDHDPENLKLRESMMLPVLFKILKEMDEELRTLRAEVEALKGQG